MLNAEPLLLRELLSGQTGEREHKKVVMNESWEQVRAMSVWSDLRPTADANNQHLRDRSHLWR